MCDEDIKFGEMTFEELQKFIKNMWRDALQNPSSAFILRWRMETIAALGIEEARDIDGEMYCFRDLYADEFEIADTAFDQHVDLYESVNAAAGNGDELALQFVLMDDIADDLSSDDYSVWFSIDYESDREYPFALVMYVQDEDSPEYSNAVDILYFKLTDEDTRVIPATCSANKKYAGKLMRVCIPMVNG